MSAPSSDAGRCSASISGVPSRLSGAIRSRWASALRRNELREEIRGAWSGKIAHVVRHRKGNRRKAAQSVRYLQLAPYPVERPRQPVAIIHEAEQFTDAPELDTHALNGVACRDIARSTFISFAPPNSA
jgi:hypothetical protein